MTRNVFENYLKQHMSKGTIISSEGTLFQTDGLPGVVPQEMVIVETGAVGFVFGISKGLVDIVLTHGELPAPGEEVVRTGMTMSFPASNSLVGHIVSPLGVDYLTQTQHHGDLVPVEQKALGIAKRAKIDKQLLTGSVLVDMLLPLGMGQRELILGDRKTGKTHFAIESIVSQAKKGTICIYVAIGNPLSAVKELALYLEKEGVMDKTVIIATSPEDPAGLIHLAPFSGMRQAEYLRDQGQDTLIIFDDLSSHARSYRQLSLLARRFPGRNSYPGDIFYLHARLLERAGNFSLDGAENVSITCLPIAETQQGDLTGYIQTNIMSMTDGHLFFDEERFLEGARPAIHPFLSVTRVGRQTTAPLIRKAISDLTSFLTRAQELSQVSHFGQELSDDAKVTLEKADKLNFLFTLPGFGNYTQSFQFFIIALIWDGYWLRSYHDTVQDDIQKLHKLRPDGKTLEGLLELENLTEAGHQARKIDDQLFEKNV